MYHISLEYFTVAGVPYNKLSIACREYIKTDTEIIVTGGNPAYQDGTYPLTWVQKYNITEEHH